MFAKLDLHLVQNGIDIKCRNYLISKLYQCEHIYANLCTLINFEGVMNDIESKIFEKVHVNTWEELRTFLSEFDNRWLFRGQANAEWTLSSRIERLPHDKKKPIEISLLQKLEAFIYNFSLPKIPSTKKEKLILLQHYGAPTRLLDVTRSPYVAIFFALSPDYEYSAIYAFNGIKLWTLLNQFKGKKYSEYISKELEDSVPSLLMCGFEEEKTLNDLVIENRMEEDFVCPIQPTYHQERTIPQASEFLVASNIEISFLANLDYMLQKEDSGNYEEKKYFYKILFPQTIRMEALSDLNRMNINQAALFPGLDGFINSLYTTYEIESFQLKQFINSGL